MSANFEANGLLRADAGCYGDAMGSYGLLGYGFYLQVEEGRKLRRTKKDKLPTQSSDRASKEKRLARSSHPPEVSTPHENNDSEVLWTSLLLGDFLWHFFESLFGGQAMSNRARPIKEPTNNHQ